jgi:energy-coupling factor transport system ATP-binding protein
MEILSCKELKFTYNGAAKPTLTNVSFSVLQGDVVLLAGLTGSGKSTLLRLLKKEIAPVGNLEGEITVKGEPQTTGDGLDSNGALWIDIKDLSAENATPFALIAAKNIDK